ncbi:MAG: glycosyltransferase family 2 protein [Bryobacteraceae bacterium]
MPELVATVVVPTLAADRRLLECLESLAQQTRRDFEVIVVDNSGRGLVRGQDAPRRQAVPPEIRVIENSRNAGFGAAINQGLRASSTRYVATLNDDAVAHPGWLEALVRALDRRPDAGMCASQVRLYGEHRLDSAGMLLARDGSSKQRGHGKAPEDFPVEEEVLLPSGSAALYRRAMLEEIGGFDDHFFLYCEDTDLGLRARWRGWKCLYSPLAVVEHHYSHSAGEASPLKACLVERNRLFVLAKNFPARMLWLAPFAAVARYFWHFVSLAGGRGSAARFRAGGHSGARMLWYVIRAHAALLRHGLRLWRERRRIQRNARITPAVFQRLARSGEISARRVAEL